MTNKEAADILDPKTSRKALMPYATDCQMRMAVVNEACTVAAKVLRGGGWISVEERMPLEYDSVFAKAYGTDKWEDAMFRKVSDEVLVSIKFENGSRMVTTQRTHDGRFPAPRIRQGIVTHWMPLPEPPEV